MASGMASDSSARRGVPPIAATSDRFTASAFQPTSAGELRRRSKCTDSTSESVVRISRAPRSGAATAASSPIPTVSQGGGGGRRARIASIRSRSDSLSRVFDGPCLTDDGDLDLSWILELVLDPLRDVLREPDGLFVAHPIALDDDADLAAGLERERLRHALERIGDAFELFEALHVRLEDVAARAGARRRNGVGRLHDHRLERRPVDVHVVRGDRLQHGLALAVAPQEVEPELEVRALQIAIDRLADVVEERG